MGRFILEKAILYGDLHIYKHLSKAIFEDVAQGFLLYLMDYAITNNIKKIFFLGDFFHIKNKLNVPPFIKSIDILRSMRYAGLELTFIIGNHDMPQLDTTDLSIIHAFEDYGKVISYYDFIDLNDTRMHFLSYTKELPKFEVASDKKNVLFSHLDIANFAMEGSFLCKEGFAIKDFKSFDQVFSGHFHKHQVRDNIVYVGSPYQTRYSERHDDKGFVELDLDSLDWKFIIYDESPKFKEVDINDYNNEDIVGNFVRLKTHKDNLDLEEIKQNLLDNGAETVDFIFKNDDEEKELSIINDLSMGSMKELASLYLKEIEGQGLFGKSIDELMAAKVVNKDDLMKAFNDIEEANLSSWKPEEEL